MRRVIPGLLLALSLMGCNAIKKKYDNPVFAAAPRRIGGAEETQIAAKDNQEEIRTVSAEMSLPTAEELEAESIEFNSSALATVNGAPVFGSEIVERYGGPLQQARKKLAEQRELIVAQRDKVSPAEYQKLAGRYLQSIEQYRGFRDQIVRQDLRSHIERRLLIELLKADMKADQIKTIETQLEKQFEEAELPKLKRELKASTKPELERELMKRDTSIATIRNSFIANIMAVQYVRSNIPRPDPATRPEILAYYEEHQPEFEIEARVRWRQIQCTSSGSTARGEAEKKIRAARAELQRGQPFAAIARKYSDDPMAKDGGTWDWITPGSLADKSLEDRLFQAPIGEVSGVIGSGGSFVIFEVLERHDAGVRPFDAVLQNEIKDKIDKQRQAEAPREFLKQIWDSAVIETTYEFVEPPKR
jgi:parvulin-like peptidyl-prolyl isomerase